MKTSLFLLAFVVLITANVFAQNTAPFPTPTPQSPPKLSQLLAANLDKHDSAADVPRAEREQAYVKLLEGQRFYWAIGNTRRGRTPAVLQSNIRQARQAFQSAIELNPKLAEAYTALAELSINTSPVDIDEAIELSRLAIKIEPNNFGSRQKLARLYTYRSEMAQDKLTQPFADQAVVEWKHVAKLDPRNAEAWAFLSEFYDRQNKPAERIDALQKWLSAVPPIDTQFYQRTMGDRGSLAPEGASSKLGSALMKAGRTREAMTILSQLVADDPENMEAVELLRGAVESSKGETAVAAVGALKQAVYANPTNFSLVSLLADVQYRAGDLNEAVGTFKSAAAKAAASDADAATSLYLALGDLYTRAERPQDAVGSYEEALRLRGIDNAAAPVSEDKREAAVQIFSKIIEAHKNANRLTDAKAAIDRAKKLLGSDDLFADRQLIAFYRETGKRQEALAAIRAALTKLPGDVGLTRLEASVLTELGRVDEGVALIKTQIDARKTGRPVTGSTTVDGSTTASIGLPGVDEFLNYLFISSLYTQAGRGKDAIDAANQAYNATREPSRRQLARLTLASAQQSAGDFAGAEKTLREILAESSGNPIALNNLGYFLLERDQRIEEAFDLIQQAVKIDPTNPSYLDSLGWAYFKMGKLVEAEKYIKEALRYDTMSSATLREHLGDIYDKQGKKVEAREWWQKALTLASEKADLERLKVKLK